MYKNYLFSVVAILLCASSTHPQQDDFLSSKDSSFIKIPQKVYRYCYVIESADWYQNQEILWKAETIKAPQNAEAWRNYYFATRYARMGMDEAERAKILRAIVNAIGENISDSYLYPYLQYYNGERNVEHLEKALLLKPDFADLYWEFIQYHELNGTKAQKKKFCEKLYSSKDIIPSLYDFNFNILNSTEKNSILFTNGDNDNYPAWVLQEIRGIRKDVTILNAHTVFVLSDYLKMKLDDRGIKVNLDDLDKEDISVFLKQLISSIKKKYPEIPISIAPTVNEEYIKRIKNKLFITGLGYTYSEKPIENIALIKKNLEQKLRLDYLEHDWYNEDHKSRTLIDQYNLNYIPAFMELAKMYYAKDEFDLAKHWQVKAILLAKRTNDKNLLKKIEDWEW